MLSLPAEAESLDIVHFQFLRGGPAYAPGKGIREA